MSKRIKKASKKLMALVLAIVTVLTMLPLNGSTFQPETAEAATGNTYRDLAKLVNSLAPFETYAMPASKANRIYGYNNRWCGWWTTPYWIGVFAEPIVVLGMTEEGMAVEVAYLNGSGKQRVKWFKTADIFGLSSISLSECGTSVNTTVYRMQNASRLRSYGTIYGGSDKCYQLGTYQVGSQVCYPTIYELSNTKSVNGVSGIRYKMGLATKNFVLQERKTVTLKQNQFTLSGYGARCTMQYYHNSTAGLGGRMPVYSKADWKSSNTDVATVDSNGVVTAVYNGTTTITAKVGNQTLQATITVINSLIPISKVLYRLPGSGSELKTTLVCAFDGYTGDLANMGYRHEGIDFRYKKTAGTHIYSLIDGEITRVHEDGTALSTIAVYNKEHNLTVIYLHANPNKNLKVGQLVTKGVTLLGTEASYGTDNVHTHVEIRLGKQTHASVSSDSKLNNPDPTGYWRQLGYEER